MSDAGISLNPDQCRCRQQRFARVLCDLGSDVALLCRPEHVQYFTGFRPHPLHRAVVLVAADGRTVLLAPNQIPSGCAADEIIPFEAQWRCTLRQDQLSAAMSVLDSANQNLLRNSLVGVEGSIFSPLLPGADSASSNMQITDVEPDLWRLRRRKDFDELAMIRRAIDCTDAMYRRAREIIEPGITELEVYNQLQAAAVKEAGEPLTALGNDFQCNSPGGPPRTRMARAGELFILDLGPAYRGYFADNCRTFAVGQSISDEQQRAWEAIVEVLELIERAVRPGASAKDLYQRAKEMLDAAIPEGFFHHLGHGIGLFPHETPHLNDHWDDLFQVGDVFTAEPGLYSPELRAGIRLEQNYVVIENGVERLTHFPLEL